MVYNMAEKKGSIRKGYRFTRRMIFKMKKLLETGLFDNETEILETSVDILYEKMIEGKLKEFVEEYEVE